MNEREAVHVLAVCSSYDGRKPSTVDAQTWAYELRHVDRGVAIDAVREYYRRFPDGRIRPGHVTEYVAELRRPGIARSSRIENAAVEALDPDDPEYNARYMAAIQDARARAAQAPEAIPERVGLPTRPVPPSERAQRAHRGAAIARAALAEARKSADADRPGPTEADLKRERVLAAAAEHKARRGGGPGSLTEAGARFLTQAIPDREDHR